MVDNRVILKAYRNLHGLAIMSACWSFNKEGGSFIKYHEFHMKLLDSDKICTFSFKKSLWFVSVQKGLHSVRTVFV